MTHFPARRFTRRPSYASAPVSPSPSRRRPGLPFTTAQRLALQGLAGVMAGLVFVALLCLAQGAA